MILLAIKIRSKDIYNDAYIHFVGQCSDSDRDILSEKSRLPSTIHEDAMEQIFQLSVLRSNVDRLLTVFISGCLVVERGYSFPNLPEETRKSLGTVYKQMLLNNFEEKSLARGEAKLYRGVNQIVNSLSSSHNARVLLDSFKDKLQGLLKTNLMLHRVGDFEHLTCASVALRYPWNDTDDW
jgi:hypothetical protein